MADTAISTMDKKIYTTKKKKKKIYYFLLKYF